MDTTGERKRMERQLKKLMRSLKGFMNIVLIHYLEIKGAKQSFNRAKEAEENAGLSNSDSPVCSYSSASQSQVASQSMDAEGLISGHISEYEDAETGNSRASSRYHPFTEMQQPVDGIMMSNFFGVSSPSVSVNNLGYLGEMQPTGANFTNHFATRNDIARVFNETGSDLGGGAKTSIDSLLLGEPFPEYPGSFMESALYSSVATLGNNLDDGLQTFMSEALYTNNLTEKEVDALRLSAAGIASSKVVGLRIVPSTILNPGEGT